MIVYGGFTINDNVLEQISRTSEYIKDTMNLPFPKSVPYFKVIFKETYEKPNKQLRITPQEYQYEHLKRIGDRTDHEILDGNHFIYENNIEEIALIVEKVLSFFRQGCN